MKFKLAQNQLAVLQEKSKLYSYLSAEFTKTYFALGDGYLTIFFHGARGALKTKIATPEVKTEETQYFQIDYNKWLNALSKLSFADEIELSLTAKFLKIGIEGSSDSIVLGIISYEPDSSEASNISSFIETKTPVTKATMSLTREVADALQVTNTMFTSAGKNNAVAIRENSIVYSDRSIVLQVRVADQSAFLQDRACVNLHKFVAGFMLQAMRFNADFSFDQDYELISWKDSDTQVLIVSERCEIALPSDEEILMIQPNETSKKGVFSIPQHALYNSLEFFNGFYEASVWKPITFLIENGSAKLYYKHPTTEISKVLDAKVEIAQDGEFPIVSEMLSKLLQKAMDSASGEEAETLVTFTYDAEAPGVHCAIGSAYDVVFAKLVQ